MNRSTQESINGHDYGIFISTERHKDDMCSIIIKVNFIDNNINNCYIIGQTSGNLKIDIEIYL